MGLYCFLFLVTSQTVTASYYYEDNRSRQCANTGEARFGFPLPVGDITGHIDEINPSGLAHSRHFTNILYFTNDIAGANIVYAINADNAKIIGSITITDATNVDWEDVTVGVCPAGLRGFCIYVQDAGSDDPGPAHVIYVIQEESDPATHISKKADRIIKYQFQPGNKPKKSNGLFVDCQRNIFFFDDPEGGLGARLYQLAETNGQYTAVGVLQLDLPTADDGPSALSLSADCCELLIKMDDKIYYIPIASGQIQAKSLQVLPYVPDDDEETIAWSPGQDRYFVLSEDKPFTLKVARRNANVPDTKFGLGKVLGTIDDKKLTDVVGLAASRTRTGFVYAVSRNKLEEVLIVQIFQGQTAGAIKFTDKTDVRISDMAVGPCPSSFSGANCIYINTVTFGEQTGNAVLVLEEPENMFAVTSQIIGVSNILRYTLPDGGTPGAIMIGYNGEIYVLDYVDDGEVVTVYQLSSEGGTALPVATFNSPSEEDGPGAADISPCFNEILIKFEDVVLLYDLGRNSVADSFSRTPSFLPYLPEENGQSVTFSDCETYLTTSAQNKPAPLMAYDRLRRQKSRPYRHYRYQ